MVKSTLLKKSMFSRGNKIIVGGIKTGEHEFLAKKYSRTEWHLVERIDKVNEDGTIVVSCRETE